MRTASGEPLADRLAAQLRRAGAADVRFAATLDELAELADAADGPLLISGTDLVAHTAVLRHLATSPVGPTVALVLTDPPVPGRTAVREERGQIVDAGPLDALDGDATGVFGGALRVGVDDLPTLAAAARAAAVGARPLAAPIGPAGDVSPLPAGGGAGHDEPGPAVDRLVAGLAALGTLIYAHTVRHLVAHPVEDPAA
ncbi:CDP-alcohol phosphatidyltransferase family protein, partial [Micromonospora sp. NPDC049580]